MAVLDAAPPLRPALDAALPDTVDNATGLLSLAPAESAAA